MSLPAPLSRTHLSAPPAFHAVKKPILPARKYDSTDDDSDNEQPRKELDSDDERPRKERASPRKERDGRPGTLYVPRKAWMQKAVSDDFGRDGEAVGGSEGVDVNLPSSSDTVSMLQSARLIFSPFQNIIHVRIDFDISESHKVDSKILDFFLPTAIVFTLLIRYMRCTVNLDC